MALVVLLRGVNVGGHRTFRPTQVAAALKHLDTVNIGAAGTFVVRRPITQQALRSELSRLLPFETQVTICRGSEIRALAARDCFGGTSPSAALVRFVSVLPRRLRTVPDLPITLPANGPWLLKVVACDGRFVVGIHRREMKAIGCLAALDRMFSAPLTTRSWNTIRAVAARLAAPAGIVVACPGRISKR
jgi:uncharacterized protein (DUF1697 family)